MKHFIYFAIARAISQIQYRVFKRERATKGAFQLSLCGYFCSVSLRDLRVGSMTYQPSGTEWAPGQLRHSPVLLPTCPSQHQALISMMPSQVLPTRTPSCSWSPCSSLGTEEGVQQAAWNPRTSQEVTAEEEQSPYNKTLKTNKARALKALSEHCEWKLQDYGSKWLHTYRTYVFLDAPHFQPVWSDTVGAF